RPAGCPDGERPHRAGPGTYAAGLGSLRRAGQSARRFLRGQTSVEWNRGLSAAGERAQALIHDRHGAAPSGARPLDLHRKAGYAESERLGNPVEIGEFFNLAIFARNARKMRRPDMAAVTRAPEVGQHAGKWPVDGVGVDP